LLDGAVAGAGAGAGETAGCWGAAAAGGAATPALSRAACSSAGMVHTDCFVSLL